MKTCAKNQRNRSTPPRAIGTSPPAHLRREERFALKTVGRAQFLSPPSTFWRKISRRFFVKTCAEEHGVAARRPLAIGTPSVPLPAANTSTAAAKGAAPTVAVLAQRPPGAPALARRAGDVGDLGADPARPSAVGSCPAPPIEGARRMALDPRPQHTRSERPRRPRSQGGVGFDA